MDSTHSKYLLIGIATVGVLGTCFLTGWLLFMGAPEAPSQPAATPVASTTTAAIADVAKPDLHKYNITIETNADWSRIILTDGKFTQGDGQSLNAIELRSETPEQVNQFLYSPQEISIRQKQFATANIVVKGVIESAEPTVQVRIGHGDNGTVKIISPADSFINDRVLGDGQNFLTGALRLE